MQAALRAVHAVRESLRHADAEHIPSTGLGLRVSIPKQAGAQVLRSPGGRGPSNAASFLNVGFAPHLWAAMLGVSAALSPVESSNIHFSGKTTQREREREREVGAACAEPRFPESCRPRKRTRMRPTPMISEWSPHSHRRMCAMRGVLGWTCRRVWPPRGNP